MKLITLAVLTAITLQVKAQAVCSPQIVETPQGLVTVVVCQ